MKNIMFFALAAAIVVSLTGCHTRITAEKNPEQVFLIQEKVTVNGTEQIITKDIKIASGGWHATARSPLYATEALEGLNLGVQTNGTVYLSLGKYNRDLSTNSVVMVEEMFSGGARLFKEIGDAYVKIAGGGAQAATVMDVAAKAANFFVSKGGDPAKATVSTDEAAKKLTISDGSTCIECSDTGVCTDCQERDGVVRIEKCRGPGGSWAAAV